MTTIWKYEIKPTDTQKVNLPVGSRIIAIQEQKGTVCLWAEVDDRTENTESVTIEIYGTGHPIPPGNREYIGTFQMFGGDLVFHAYRRMG